jgi:hypothetical protein
LEEVKETAKGKEKFIKDLASRIGVIDTEEKNIYELRNEIEIIINEYNNRGRNYFREFGKKLLE